MLKQNISIMDKIKKDNPLVNEDLYMRIRKSLKYEFSVKDDTSQFLSILPPKLRTDLSYLILKNTVSNQVPFFKGKDKHFTVYASQFLKPGKILKGGYIFERGDPAEEIIFLVKGCVAFTLTDKNETPFLYINEGKELCFKNKIRKGHYFGELFMGVPEKEEGDKRRFTAKALEDIEFLTLNIKVCL
jgi:hypothetical protein